MSVKFEVGQYAERTEEIYKKLCDFYSQYLQEDILENLISNYKSVKPEDKINIAFIGQYSAGKSTIIKALTSDGSIVIDSDIATSSVNNYDWENVVLTDTPGLKTNENLQHDNMTLEAISKSDLLVYCITSDLFSEVTRDDFKNWAQKYKVKIFLVVNKMNKETGDYDTLVRNYSDTINRTLAPEYSISDFHHCFFDAADYVEGVEGQDDDLIDDSHFEEFIVKLNNFIKLKGLNGKMLTPVSILSDSIDNALIQIEDDEHVKELKKLVKRICKTVEEKKSQFVKASHDEVQKTARAFIQKGDEVASQLDERKYKFTDEDLQEFSEPLTEKLCKHITDYFEKYAEETDEEVKKVLSSELATHFFEEDKRKLDTAISGSGKGTEIFGTIQQGLGKAVDGMVPKFTSLMTKFSGVNVAAGEKVSIWSIRGSDLHNTVKSLGNKLGYKFKPFEALKISKKIATLSVWLGPVLTGVGTLVELFGVLAEKHSEKMTDRAKADTKEVFKALAEELEDYYGEQIDSAAKEFDFIRNELDKEIKNIDSRAQNNNEIYNKLTEIKSELNSLRHNIEYGSVEN